MRPLRARSGKYLQWGLRLLGPALLVVVLVRLPNPREVLELFSKVSPLILLSTLALNFLAIHLKTLRWQLLLRAREISYETKNAWLAFGASVYLGMLTPGRVGDVLRVQYLRHDKGTSYAEGVASVVMDRVYDLYVLVGFFAVGITHYGSRVIPELRVLGFLTVAGTLLGPLILLVPGIAERLFGGMYRKLARDPEGTGFHLFLASMRGQARKATVITLPLTIGAFLVSFAQSWLVAYAMGLDLSYFDVACLSSIATMLSLLPVSISGVGVREVLFAGVFPSLGYSAAHGVSYGLMVFVTLYLGVAAIGFVCWQIRPPPTASAPPSDEPPKGVTTPG